MCVALLAGRGGAAEPPPPTPEQAGEQAGLEASDQPFKSGGRFATKPCKCEDLKKYLEMVKKKEECYRKAHREHNAAKARAWGGGIARQPGGATAGVWSTKADLNGFIKTCMGWTTMYNIGSSGETGAGQAQQSAPAEEAPQEKKLTDREKCDRTYCEWICRVSVYGVHEPFHDWYRENQMMNAGLLAAAWVVGIQGPVALSDAIVNEIAAHKSEAQFLEDTLEEYERRGKCDRIDKTISKEEFDFRTQQALGRAKRFAESEP